MTSQKMALIVTLIDSLPIHIGIAQVVGMNKKLRSQVIPLKDWSIITSDKSSDSMSRENVFQNANKTKELRPTLLSN